MLSSSTDSEGFETVFPFTLTSPLFMSDAAWVLLLAYPRAARRTSARSGIFQHLRKLFCGKSDGIEHIGVRTVRSEAVYCGYTDIHALFAELQRQPFGNTAVFHTFLGNQDVFHVLYERADRVGIERDYL